MRSGQMFTSDLVASVVIFLTVLNLGLFAIQQSVSGQSQFNEQKRMSQTVYQVADLLVRTSGYPAKWTPETVKVVGLAPTSQVISQRELEAFRSLESYSLRQRLLGTRSEFTLLLKREKRANSGVNKTIGGPPIAYIAGKEANISSLSLINSLNVSSKTWDLYWPSSFNKSSLNSLNARNIYNRTLDEKEMFKSLLHNISDGSYAVVIAENIHVGLDGGGKQLREFVDSGGKYLHVGGNHALLANIFGYEKTGIASNGNVTVENVLPLLNRKIANKNNIELVNPSSAFRGSTKRFLNNDTTSLDHGCSVCAWSEGGGTVYYMAAAYWETDSGQRHPVGFLNADHSFFDARLMYGKPIPSNATQVVTERRKVLLNISIGAPQQEDVGRIGSEIQPVAGPGLVSGFGGSILYVEGEQERLKSGETEQNNSLGPQSVDAFGPATADLDNDDTIEVPFVNESNGDIWITDGSSTNKLYDAGDSNKADVDKTRMAVGRWQSETISVFFADQEESDIVQVYPNGSSNVILSPDVGTSAVSGIADIDSDGRDELVFAGASQSLYYLRQNGSVFKIPNGGAGSNNGIGIGSPLKFDGGVQVPFVDGSNELKVVDADGTVTELIEGEIGKQPVATFDADGDDSDEIAYTNISTNPNSVYILDGPVSNLSTFKASTKIIFPACYACRTALMPGTLRLSLWQ